MVRRRDLPEGRRPVDLSVPGDRSARPGHRCPAISKARPGSRAALLYPGSGRGHGPGRGHDRPRARLPAGSRRAGALGAAHRRAVREQPGRGRSRPAEGPAPADARAETAPVSADPGRRSCLHPEPAPAATTRSPPTSLPATGSASPFTASQPPSDPQSMRIILRRCPRMAQRNSAPPTAPVPGAPRSLPRTSSAEAGTEFTPAALLPPRHARSNPDR